MNYKFWNPNLAVQWVSEEDPAQAAAKMLEKNPDICCITATRMLWMIYTAVVEERKDEFYAQFCTPDRLLIAVTEPDALEKEALQFELSVILSVRRVNHLPTRFILPPSFDPRILTNQSLAVFLHMADRCVPRLRLQAESGLLRKLTTLSPQTDDPIFPEEEEEDELAPSTRILQEIEAKIRALEKKVMHMTEKDTDPF